jgi:hypothetical protein
MKTFEVQASPGLRHLMAIAAALSLMTLVGCAAPGPQPREDGSRTITIPAGRVAQCNAEGGCAYLSKKQAMELLEYGYAEGAESCRGTRL